MNSSIAKMPSDEHLTVPNDGKADLAIGVPGEGIGAATDAGAVNVIHGTSMGPTCSIAQKNLPNLFKSLSGLISILRAWITILKPVLPYNCMIQ